MDPILDSGFDEKQPAVQEAVTDTEDFKKQSRSCFVWATGIGIVSVACFLAYFHYRHLYEVLHQFGPLESTEEPGLLSDYNQFGIAGLVGATSSVVQYYLAFMYWVRYLGEKKKI